MFIAILKPVRAVVLLAIAAGMLLGLWRGSSEWLTAAQNQSYVGRTVQVTGTVADDVSHKNGEAGMKLKDVRVGGHELGGKVWASTSSSLDLKRGDIVSLYGKLSPGFGTFAASMSYAKLVNAEWPVHGDMSREIRDSFSAGLKRAVPEPQAALGIGYLTGQHNTIPPELTKQLQLVGLIHLVIAGGYNVTILVRFARRGFMHVSKYLAMLSAGSILFVLTLIAGFTAPMARTFVVTSISLAVWYYGRKIHPLVLLPVSAAITAVADPTFVWGDVGWYMTFVAYGGLIMLAPMLKQLLWPGKKSGVLKQIFVDTLSVQIVTMPLMAMAFQQYSIYGLPANLLVLPFMPLTMLAAAIAGLGGMVLPAAAAHIIGWPANLLLLYTTKITTWLANTPGADASASFTPLHLVLAYLFVLTLGYILWRKTHYNFRNENVVE